MTKRLLFSVMVLMGFAIQASAAVMDMDADGDGKVSLKEYSDAIEKSKEAKGEEFKKAVVERQFGRQDKNGDGFLTADEVPRGR
jgi:Ca2+-binding EF-hand superfamily protein